MFRLFLLLRLSLQLTCTLLEPLIGKALLLLLLSLQITKGILQCPMLPLQLLQLSLQIGIKSHGLYVP